MPKPPRFVIKGLALFIDQLRDGGLFTALTWLYGRGMSMITGIPLLRYCQVTPHLYVGPQYRKRGRRLLDELGIRSSVNLRIEFDDAAHGLALADYCYLPVVDGMAPSLEQLHRGVAFIHRVVGEGGKVYVHCRSGVGRAPTMAAAYLVHQGRSIDEALAQIRRVRPFIEPRPEQLAQLRRFEAAQAAPSEGEKCLQEANC